MQDEYIDIVDKNAAVLGQAYWTEVHEKGLLHVTSAVLLFSDNKKQKILVQKRSDTMKQDPGLITFSAGGHLLSGQTPLEGMKKELAEELFDDELPSDLSLDFIDRYYVNDFANNHELLCLYQTVYPGPFQVDPTEVQHVQWVSFVDLLQDIDKHPHLYTNAFRIVLHKVKGINLS